MRLPSETYPPLDRTVPLPPCGPTLYRRPDITVARLTPLIQTDTDGEWLYEMLIDTLLAEDDAIRRKMDELSDLCCARRAAQRGRQRLKVVQGSG